MSGGFVGGIEDSDDAAVTISNSTTKGSVHVQTAGGGFIGSVEHNTYSVLTISNCTNYMSVYASYVNGNYVGGYIGYVGDYNTRVSLVIINSANKGSVRSHDGWACGFLYIDYDNYGRVNSTVINSVNKGVVTGTMSAHGVSNVITKARNVVSMGAVRGSYGSYSFWEESIDVDLLYALNDTGELCVNATRFQRNTTTWFYEVVETSQHVDDLLNNETTNQDYGMMWTCNLELIENDEYSSTENEICPTLASSDSYTSEHSHGSDSRATTSSQKHESISLSRGCASSLSSLVIGLVLLFCMYSL